jgi:hypothetical protein
MKATNKRRFVAPLVRSLLIGLLGSSTLATAASITEVEPNDSPDIVQVTDVPTEGLAVSGAVGDGTGTPNADLDFIKFEASQGNTPVIEVTSPLNADGSCGDFVPILTLYDSAKNIVNEAAPVLDPCSAKIDNTALPSDGTYFVSVADYPHFGNTGGVAQNMDVPSAGGRYQLAINGVQVPPPASSALIVPIQVRHWNHEERDLGRRKNRDPITVAILSTADFSAGDVDDKSLTFGVGGTEHSLFRCNTRGNKDMNRDGLADKVCYFKPDVANFQTGDRSGVLKGKTKSGQQIEGRAALKIFSMPSNKSAFKHKGGGRKNGKR